MSRSGQRGLPNRRPRHSSSASARPATCDCAATCARPSGPPIPCWSWTGSSFTRRSIRTICSTIATRAPPRPFGKLSGVQARLGCRVHDVRVQGGGCPGLCKLQEGQRGMCFVRACENGQVVLTTYGRSSGFCVDPIEKKPLNHYLPGTPILSFGTPGCNLSCKFCQN